MFFKGRNGLGSIGTSFQPGTPGARVLQVQRILDSISTPSAAVADRTSVFDSSIVGGQISQTTSDDLSDQLFCAVIELP